MVTCDLTGKIAIVTGSNSGLGKETARKLVQGGATCILACRSLERAEEAKKDIQEGARGAVVCMQLDLCDLESVKTFCSEFLKKYSTLNILVCNGGLNGDGSYKGPKTTPQGLEIVFGTNYVGHFMLTALLMDALKKGGTPESPSRVVSLASVTVWFASTKFHNYAKGPAKTKGNYACSKIACTMMAVEIARKMEGSNVMAFAADPGYVNSGIWRDNKLMGSIANALALSPAQGARTSVEAATRMDFKSGSYLMPFTFKYSSIMKMAPSLGYNLMPLFSKLFYGIVVDKSAPKTYKQESIDELFTMTYKLLEEANCPVPKMF
ncbi:hypothetical protein CYMTET_6898 [Cymbomonas tetramitiformis]|uniref:Uncharacterized protein n=1 Tax=Cymbomonas tetramitiformis TaxID=36881 RepID=A0AAE0GY07_9CHLO|nr:hypothetical protein CYMTET_6898 [Cymbomonas tetramitiformis]|eukprot:gene2172-2880_t